MDDFIVKYWKLILIAVLLFSFLLHIRYMNVNQAVWWDEADYLSIGKHYGLGTPEIAAPWRSRLMPMFWAPFFFLGLGEGFIRFLGIVAVVFASFLTFKLGEELFNKKIGFMAAIIVTVLPEVMFWSARVSLDVYAMVMWLAIGYCFWKGYVKDGKKWYLIVAGAVLGAGIFAYESVGFAFPFIFVFLFVTERFRFLKNKKFWILVVAILIAMSPMLVYNQVNHGNPYPRLFNMIFKQYAPTAEGGAADLERPASAIFMESLQYTKSFKLYMEWPFFIAFLVGLIGFINMFIGFDYVWKNKNELLKKYFYIFIWILTVLVFFGIVQSTTAFAFEPRFMFAMYPVMCIVVALGIERISSYIAKYNKQAAIVAMVLILIIGIYYSLDFGINMINAKKDTYAQEKPAGLWLKQNTNKGDILLGCGLTVPITYYSEREVVPYGGNDFEVAKEKILENNPKYYIVDLFDPNCRPQFPFEKREIFTPVQAFFFDEQQQQPVFVIFNINYAALQQINTSAL